MNRIKNSNPSAIPKAIVKTGPILEKIIFYSMTVKPMDVYTKRPAGGDVTDLGVPEIK